MLSWTIYLFTLSINISQIPMIWPSGCYTSTLITFNVHMNHLGYCYSTDSVIVDLGWDLRFCISNTQMRPMFLVQETHFIAKVLALEIEPRALEQNTAPQWAFEQMEERWVTEDLQKEWEGSTFGDVWAVLIWLTFVEIATINTGQTNENCFLKAWENSKRKADIVGKLTLDKKGNDTHFLMAFSLRTIPSLLPCSPKNKT